MARSAVEPVDTGTSLSCFQYWNLITVWNTTTFVNNYHVATYTYSCTPTNKTLPGGMKGRE